MCSREVEHDIDVLACTVSKFPLTQITGEDLDGATD
jgi:hypothetical protein